MDSDFRSLKKIQIPVDLDSGRTSCHKGSTINHLGGMVQMKKRFVCQRVGAKIFTLSVQVRGRPLVIWGWSLFFLEKGLQIDLP